MQWFHQGGSGNLQIGFAPATTDDLYNGGCFFGATGGMFLGIGLGKQLQQLGFNSFTFVLVHQFFFLVFLGFVKSDRYHQSSAPRESVSMVGSGSPPASLRAIHLPFRDLRQQ
jgi:hypothetical protein